MRILHKWYAKITGYFWLPCVLCGKEFGGHEWRDIDGLPSMIQTEEDKVHSTTSVTRSTGICPNCTRAGLGTHKRL